MEYSKNLGIRETQNLSGQLKPDHPVFRQFAKQEIKPHECSGAECPVCFPSLNRIAWKGLPREQKLNNQPPGIAWYCEVVQRWADKEKDAAREKLANYGIDDDVFGILKNGARRAGIDLWSTWFAWTGRHFDALTEDAPLPIRYARLKDVFGYINLGMVLSISDFLQEHHAPLAWYCEKIQEYADAEKHLISNEGHTRTNDNVFLSFAPYLRDIESGNTSPWKQWVRMNQKRMEGMNALINTHMRFFQLKALHGEVTLGLAMCEAEMMEFSGWTKTL